MAICFSATTIGGLWVEYPTILIKICAVDLRLCSLSELRSAVRLVRCVAADSSLISAGPF
ncbi:hypothetical protein EYF80_030995 [Liparis tanakae]|uniref:Uncharacterized protein n=1 Tax=Liparis tanakae TaxID=230148 RepID=A0A4Z2GZS8_9TELE|nr:hypothetical protein EYF80_030995 [Liparis tanakae]